MSSCLQRWQREFAWLHAEVKRYHHVLGEEAPLRIYMKPTTSRVSIDMLRTALGRGFSVAEDRLVNTVGNGTFAISHRYIVVRQCTVL